MARISSPTEEAWTGEREQTIAEVPEAAASPWQRVWAFLRGPYPTLVSRLLLGGILVISGLTKLGVPALFADTINSYEMSLPTMLVNLMAAWLPVLELGLGVWLIAGLFMRFSALLSGVIMLVFLVAITQAWLRGLNVNCGCFAGEGGNPVGLAILKAMGPVGDWLGNEKAGPEAVLRDLAFVGMAAHLFFVPTIFSLDALRNRGRVADEEQS